jgi:hypothetical protein
MRSLVENFEGYTRSLKELRKLNEEQMQNLNILIGNNKELMQNLNIGEYNLSKNGEAKGENKDDQNPKITKSGEQKLYTGEQSWKSLAFVECILKHSTI